MIRTNDPCPVYRPRKGDTRGRTASVNQDIRSNNDDHRHCGLTVTLLDSFSNVLPDTPADATTQ